MIMDFAKEKIVYVVNGKAALTAEILQKQGFRVEVGEGVIKDEILKDTWALLPGRAKVPDEVLEKAPHLKLVCKQGVGVERIDVEACTKRGICVANTPNSNFISVAEHTILLMLAAAKWLYPLSRDLRWTKCSEQNYFATELMGKTLSVIGLGRIGMRVAELGHAFGMNVVAYVRNPKGRQIPEYISLAETMDEAIEKADVLSLHVAGTEENCNLIGKRELELMKKSSILINTTRGFVVDEEALYEALKSRQIAGAGLDVFADESMDPSNPLLELDNLVATPHTAANTKESRRRAFEECAEIVMEFAQGKRPASALN